VVFFGRILLQLHDEAVLLDLDPLDQQGGVGVVDRARALVSRLQDNLADLIIDVRGRDP
jgi:hypothetical protein